MYKSRKLQRGQGMLLSRRRFVQGVLASGAISACDLWCWPVSTDAATALAAPPLLSGNYFNLEVEQVLVNYTGRAAHATTVNGSVPGPTLRWREGDIVTLVVTNRLKEATSIHWHGIRTPSEMDGVP